MKEEPINPDIDSTRTLSKKEFSIFRYWAHSSTQQELAAHSGIPLGTVKVIVSDVYSILGESDKGKAIHLCWKRGIFTQHNCHLPQ
ncbi:MAG: hypothetical protein HY063_04125 [Bacteroidetes bacterium]|nr:hypothetical protein [Bacteroidota bacterium]